jgi:antitoxin HigA-1
MMYLRGKAAMVANEPESSGADLQEVAALPPLHPGEVLREEFLEPLGLSADGLAQACGVDLATVEQVSTETLRIDAELALRLGRVLGTTAEFWVNLQARYDLDAARALIWAELERLQPIARSDS